MSQTVQVEKEQQETENQQLTQEGEILGVDGLYCIYDETLIKLDVAVDGEIENVYMRYRGGANMDRLMDWCGSEDLMGCVGDTIPVYIDQGGKMWFSRYPLADILMLWAGVMSAGIIAGMLVNPLAFLATVGMVLAVLAVVLVYELRFEL
jgi:hypothetical protein